MAYSLGGTSLDYVTSEKCIKQSGLYKQVMPTLDSNQTITIDLFGAERTIAISGKFVRDNVAALATISTTMLSKINGNQATITYVSDLLGTVNVKVNSVDLSWVEGTTQILEFSIELIETAV